MHFICPAFNPFTTFTLIVGIQIQERLQEITINETFRFQRLLPSIRKRSPSTVSIDPTGWGGLGSTERDPARLDSCPVLPFSFLFFRGVGIYHPKEKRRCR